MKNVRSVRSLESDVNLFELLQAMFSNLHWILLISLLVAGLMWGVSFSKVKPEYTSETVYAVRTQLKDGELFSQIIRQDSFLTEVKSSLGLDVTLEQFRGLISVNTVLTSSDLDTTYISVIVTWQEKVMGQKISEKIAADFIHIAPDILPLEEIFIVSSMTAQSVNPSNILMQRIIIGLLLGSIISVGYILIAYLFDQRIRSGEEMMNLTEIPVVTNIIVKK